MSEMKKCPECNVENYDRMVQSDEYIELIRNMHDMELKAREEQLQKQYQIELELKNDIL